MSRLGLVASELDSLDCKDGLQWACKNFLKPCLASSLGEEDQVLTHLIATQKLPIEIFTLDTGRLFQETYELLELTQSHYNLRIEVYFPEQEQVENYVKEKGINGFYYSIENRKECCAIRKVYPLKRALRHADLWITGLRRSQSPNRQQMKKVEWNEEMKLIKYNPLIDWTDNEVQRFIDENKVPVNPLHSKGFKSIGCAPCTRALLPGEDARAGRWWWEGSSKECGLHEMKSRETR
jgi:phosphoadenosine phosphosulfate reductase